MMTPPQNWEFMEVFGKRLAPRTCEGGVSPNGLTGGVKTGFIPNSPSQIALNRQFDSPLLKAGAEAAYNSKQLDKLKFE